MCSAHENHTVNCQTIICSEFVCITLGNARHSVTTQIMILLFVHTSCAVCSLQSAVHIISFVIIFQLPTTWMCHNNVHTFKHSTANKYCAHTVKMATTKKSIYAGKVTKRENGSSNEKRKKMKNFFVWKVKTCNGGGDDSDDDDGSTKLANPLKVQSQSMNAIYCT